MKNTEDIHQLIRALSKAEKRHFKMSAARYSKNQNNYLLLFDAIDQQDHYDESRLKQKFSKYAFGKSIHKTKYLLYELILRSLRPLSNGKSIRDQLEGKMQSVDFLFSKGLYDQAEILLRKVKKLALHYQLLPLQLRVLDWEKRLVHYTQEAMTLTKVEDLLDEYDQVASQVRIEMRFRVIVEKCHHLSKLLAPEQCAQALADSLDDFPIQDHRNAPTFLAQVFRNELLARHAFHQGQVQQALRHLRAINELWQTYPWLSEVYPQELQRTTETYLSYQLDNPKATSASFTEILDFFREHMHFRTSEEEEKLELQYTMLDFISNLNRGNLQICATQLLVIRDSVERYEELVDLSTQIQLYYHIGIYYFFVRDFSEALDWILRTQQKTNRQLHPRSQRFCELIELMTRYELGEYEYLASAVRKMYRNLKQKPHVVRIESLILRSVRQLLNVSDSSQVKPIFEQLYDSLQQIEDPMYQRDHLQTDLLYRWIHEYLPPRNEEDLY